MLLPLLLLLLLLLLRQLLLLLHPLRWLLTSLALRQSPLLFGHKVVQQLPGPRAGAHGLSHLASARHQKGEARAEVVS